MDSLSVWAPGAESVDLAIGPKSLATAQDKNGWWTVISASIQPGAHYMWSVDGSALLPDPRSLFQPMGIDGPSEVVDHDAFNWTDDQWGGLDLGRSVMYELHIGTFSTAGTFDGAIEHLPHLVELGVDAVEVMPVNEFSGDRGWGYDGAFLFAPHHAYGGPGGFKRFVGGCHAHGLGVILDVVYNHLGPAGNHLARFGPYFTDRHQTPWGDAVNFDGPGSIGMRRFVTDNALMWLRDYHCDGLRLDAVHAIIDESPVHILAELADRVGGLETELGRPLSLIAENDTNDPVLVRDQSEGGFGLDSAWADDWHHALHTVLTGESSGYYEDFGSVDQLVKALEQAWVYDGVVSEHRGRVVGSSAAGLSASKFVICTQNHDQVGNRATGERSSALMSEGRLRIAAALMLFSPFVPMLFQGEEWAASTPFLYFTDHHDRDLGRAVSEGRRREFAAFGWDPEDVPDPQTPESFEHSKLNWNELNGFATQSMLDWYTQLLSLRRNNSDLADPDIRARASHQENVIVVRRGRLNLIANLSERQQAVEFSTGGAVLLQSPEGVETKSGEPLLAPDSLVILSDPQQ